MSTLILSRGIQALGALLVVVGIAGLAIAITLSNNVQDQVGGLEQMEAGVADTLDDAAIATQGLALELQNVRPVLDDAEALLLQDVVGILQAASNGLDNLEAGVADAQPVLVNTRRLLENDTPQLLDAGINVIGSGDALLGEILSPAQNVSRAAHDVEADLQRLLGKRAVVHDSIARATQDLNNLEVRPFVVTARDIRAVSGEIRDFTERAGLQVDTQALDDHALYLEQQDVTYWFQPTATYRVSATDLRWVADELEAAISGFGGQIQLDTGVLRREADRLDREGIVIEVSASHALAALDAMLGDGFDLAERYGMSPVADVATVINNVSSELDSVHRQVPAAERFLSTLKDDSLVLADIIGRADATVDTASQDLASISGGLRDAQGRIQELATVVQVGHDVANVAEQNLTTLSEGLSTNAADVRNMQAGALISDTFGWLTSYMVLTYVLFLLAGVGLFFTGWTLARTLRELETAIG